MKCTCALAVREATAPLLAEIERLTADRDDQNRVLRQMVQVGNSRSAEIDRLRGRLEQAQLREIELEEAFNTVIRDDCTPQEWEAAYHAVSGGFAWSDQPRGKDDTIAELRLDLKMMGDICGEREAEIERLRSTYPAALERASEKIGERDRTIAELRDHLSLAEDVNRALRAMLDGRNAPPGCQEASEPQSPPAARSEALRDDPTFPPEDMIA